jgi:hypothetical protein
LKKLLTIHTLSRWLAPGLIALSMWLCLGGGRVAALALPDVPLTTVAAASTCNKPTLLGIFVPWFQYLNIAKDSTGYCEVQNFHLLPGKASDGLNHPSDVPLVLLAVVDDMLRLAGLITVIFVIYGGIKYATSQGDPDSVAKAQSTVVNALIGLAIAMVAVVFVTFIGRALGTK